MVPVKSADPVMQVTNIVHHHSLIDSLGCCPYDETFSVLSVWARSSYYGIILHVTDEYSLVEYNIT
jgi:hypothetical protein